MGVEVQKSVFREEVVLNAQTKETNLEGVSDLRPTGEIRSIGTVIPSSRSDSSTGSAWSAEWSTSSERSRGRKCKLRIGQK